VCMARIIGKSSTPVNLAVNGRFDRATALC